MLPENEVNPAADDDGLGLEIEHEDGTVEKVGEDKPAEDFMAEHFPRKKGAR